MILERGFALFYPAISRAEPLHLAIRRKPASLQPEHGAIAIKHTGYFAQHRYTLPHHHTITNNQLLLAALAVCFNNKET